MRSPKNAPVLTDINPPPLLPRPSSWSEARGEAIPNTQWATHLCTKNNTGDRQPISNELMVVGMSRYTLYLLCISLHWQLDEQLTRYVCPLILYVIVLCPMNSEVLITMPLWELAAIRTILALKQCMPVGGLTINKLIHVFIWFKSLY